jgi:hypothetical protein
VNVLIHIENEMGLPSNIHITGGIAKRTLGRPRRSRVDNIMMDLGEIAQCSMEFIGLALDNGKGFFECRNEPSGYFKC